MNPRMLAALVITLAAGVGLGWLLFSHTAMGPERSAASAGEAAASSEPLYWVAPMDPGYRRDGPGKSPMGMDLVPVYANGDAAAGGGVHIDPGMAQDFGVRLATVQRAVLDDGFATLGSVALAEPRITHVHPRVSGWVERLAVSAEGDPVHAGDVLMELYSPDLVRAQDEYLIARRQGDDALREASATRLRSLGMTPSQITALARSGHAQERIPILADTDGFVAALKVREGMYIQPSTEVMALGVTDPVWVFAEVFEHQVSAVAVGQSARLTLDFLPGREWTGEVEFLYPQLDMPLRTLQVRMRFANPDGALRPGMFGTVHLGTLHPQPTLVVPREALIRTGGTAPDRVVVALPDDRYRARAVRVGRVAGDAAEILSGLREGERVVASGQFLIDSESDVDADLLRIDAGGGQAGGAGADDAAMNHSGMDHSDTSAPEMGHSDMDHSDMDHTDMDHSGTDHSAMDPAPMAHPDSTAPTAADGVAPAAAESPR